MANKKQFETDRDERISRYLKGQMTAPEETKFLSDMESDELLKQDAIAQARLVKGMAQVDDELIHELKNASKTKIVSSVRPHKTMFRKSGLWISAAASVAVLLLIGYKGYDYYDTTRLGMEYAKTFPMETIVRGESNTQTEKELQTLFENVIDRKDLSYTTERLSELWEISNQETYNDYTDYAPYIGWYLAIGYLEEYEKEKAKSVLNVILKQKDGNSDTFLNEVSILLNKI